MVHDALWAPWRLAYLRDLKRRDDDARAGAAPAGSAATENFLLDYWRHPEHDERSLVVFRDAHGMILLNRFPYANGHLLVALGTPAMSLQDYDPQQRAALWILIERAIELVERTLEPQGINMGMNQGRAAGAGLPEHIHAHVVPRWGGDTNFMGTIGQVRVIPDALEAVWKVYRETVRHLGWDAPNTAPD